MEADAARARWEQLAQALRYHNYRYHVLDEPELSDSAYDALMNELRALEEATPALRTPDSPTQRVGDTPLDLFAKVAHRLPMLSLGNSFDEEGTRRWHERVRRMAGEVPLSWTVEPKIDGLAVALTYVGGHLTLGATRGNGTIGEEITPNLRTVRGIPLRVPVAAEGAPPAPERIEVRGEVYMRRSDFERMNRQQAEADEKIFANPRNAAAGSLPSRISGSALSTFGITSPARFTTT